MTEQEWLQCTDPQKMLAFLPGKASDRQLRLFACACCRQIWHLLADERMRQAAEMGERYADGNASRDDLMASCRAAHQARRLQTKVYGRAAADCANLIARNCAHQAFRFSRLEGPAQCHLFRDILGNPFRPAHLPPDLLTWNNGAIPRLAQAIYDDRAFDRLPSLADALEDAGCVNSDILDHCRGPGPHVRGCWIIDLILAKDR
jgi:hypothetical protein